MIVVDCSVVVDALTGFGDSEPLRAGLADRELNAPSLIDYEFTSALRGLTLGDALTETRARDALADFDSLPLRRWEAGDALRQRAFSLRANLTAYDAAYVTLAEALGCELVTRDARLARSSGHEVTITVL